MPKTARFKYNYVILRNMELIAKISKGSKMDQVYIPKNRIGFSAGSYVIIRPLEGKKTVEKPYLYNIKSIEPVKLEIAEEIISIIDKITENENIIISEGKADEEYARKSIEDSIKIKTHIILLDDKALIKGLETDPIYQMMLSRCIAKKRFIYKTKNKINYKLLDLHLLKSKSLIDNFGLLNGEEKYYLTRNMVAISLFLQNKKIDKEKVDKEIIRIFDLRDINDIKQNILDKNNFLKNYKNVYKKTFDMVMESINGPKQEKIN